IVASLSGAPLPSPRKQLTQGDWLPGFQMHSGDALRISVRRLCWLSHLITFPQPIIELFIPLDPKKDMLWLRREGRVLSLKGKEVAIDAENANLKITPYNLRLQTQVQHNPRLQTEGKLKGGVPTMSKAKWMVIPLLLLASATNVQAQIEGQTVEQTMTGLFEDAATGQRQTLTLDLVNPELNPPGDWVTIDTETYLIHLDAYDDYSRLEGLILTDENGNVLDQVAADPPVSALHAVGLRVFGGSVQVGGKIDFQHAPN
ncbi:MAG: hypothetical protein NZT92_19400, partial [Abditibacteriales bacterium]|nr:hypothetical protein [Abditibacteriales bacterium]MDW8365693.1 hypothetical protein [Abditibacteriales bacterium]